jgi:hypothetical protein
MTKKIYFLAFFLSFLLVTILVGVFLYSYTQKPASSPQIILKQTTSGGLCQNGGCYHETILYDNGDFGKKHLSKEQVSTLKNLIASTNFDAYQKNPKAFCQSYLDGSDLGYVFPQKDGDRNLVLCQYSIPKNDPLFSYLNSL